MILFALGASYSSLDAERALLGVGKYLLLSVLLCQGYFKFLKFVFSLGAVVSFSGKQLWFPKSIEDIGLWLRLFLFLLAYSGSFIVLALSKSDS